MVHDHSRGDWIAETYTFGQDRTLSEAVISAVEAHERSDLRRETFALYEDVDPDALDALFREGGDSVVWLEFDVGDVRVCLHDRDGGGVDIRTADIPGNRAE